MLTIDYNGARIAYADTGSGETVLLLHSSASSSAQWRSLTETLQNSHRVLAPDLYGYGETDPWPGQGPFSLSDEAALVNAILARSSGPIHLVGPSYGGAVALRFAVQQPERLRSLTLIEPVAFHLIRDTPPDGTDSALFLEVMEIAALVRRATASGDYRGAMARFVEYWNGHDAWAQTKPEVRAAIARRMPKVALDFWATTTETTPRAAFRQIAVPTLVLRGARSPQPTRCIAELVADNLPEGRLQTIDGAGHMLPLTHKEAVNAAVAEHLLRSMAAGPRPVAA